MLLFLTDVWYKGTFLSPASGQRHHLCKKHTILAIGLYNMMIFFQNDQETYFPTAAWKMTAGVVGCPAACVIGAAEGGEMGHGEVSVAASGSSQVTKVTTRPVDVRGTLR
jgi:hypothetical protein